MNSPKLTFLITNLGFGGAERQLVYVASALKARGWEVEIVPMMDLYAHGDELAAAGVPVTPLKMRQGVADPRALLSFIGHLRRSRPDLLVTFAFHANLLGRLAARPGGVPRLVCSIRNENFGGRSRDLMMRLTDPLCDLTTINSRLAAEAVLSRGVVPRPKLRVVPNGIVAGRYQAAPELALQTRRELGIAEDAFVWLTVGRLEPQKDYPTLFEALRSLGPNRLLVVGTGSRRDELGSLAERLGLADRIRFLGRRPDVPRLLAASDAFVLSSAWEGLPNVIMEALAAARPVVATEVGGVSELIEDGRSGLLVPPRSPEALGAAMRRMMMFSPDERRAMAEAGQAHVLNNYELERVVDHWEALLKPLLASNLGRRRHSSPTA